MRKEPIVVSEDIISVATKYDKICLFLDERSRRMWCAVEAESYGYGGVLLVHKATGISKSTIAKGKRELNTVIETVVDNKNHVRASGGGRKSITEKYPNLLRGCPERVISPVSPILWPN